MLGEQIGGAERAVGVKLSFRDDTRSFAEKVGSDARETHGRRRAPVGDGEADRHAIGVARDRPRLDHAPQPYRAAERQAPTLDIRRRVEERGLVPERRQGEQRRADDRGEREQRERQPLVFGLHRSDPRIAAQLAGASMVAPPSVKA